MIVSECMFSAKKIFAPLKGELEPWAVHIHDQSLYIIDGISLRLTTLRFSISVASLFYDRTLLRDS